MGKKIKAAWATTDQTVLVTILPVFNPFLGLRCLISLAPTVGYDWSGASL
jgi:hypothetical protein